MDNLLNKEQFVVAVGTDYPDIYECCDAVQEEFWIWCSHEGWHKDDSDIAWDLYCKYIDDITKRNDTIKVFERYL